MKMSNNKNIINNVKIEFSFSIFESKH